MTSRIPSLLIVVGLIAALLPQCSWAAAGAPGTTYPAAIVKSVDSTASIITLKPAGNAASISADASAFKAMLPTLTAGAVVDATLSGTTPEKVTALTLEPVYFRAIVKNVDKTTNTVTLEPMGNMTSVSADASTFKTMLPTLAIGDAVDVTLNGAKPETALALAPAVITLTWGDRLGTFGGVLFLLFIIATGATEGDPRKLIIGADGRYSNSKTQVAFWSAAVLAAYLADVMLRAKAGGSDFFGHVNIPNNLLVLSGLSALTFGGAKAITTAKVNAMTDAGNLSPKGQGDANILTDLFQNDRNETDIGDFQMILITAIAVVMFCVTFLNYLATIELTAVATLPDVDTTLLSMFGIGQGAYLVKKLASNPGDG